MKTFIVAVAIPLSLISFSTNASPPTSGSGSAVAGSMAGVGSASGSVVFNGNGGAMQGSYADASNESSAGVSIVKGHSSIIGATSASSEGGTRSGVYNHQGGAAHGGAIAGGVQLGGGQASFEGTTNTLGHHGHGD